MVQAKLLVLAVVAALATAEHKFQSRIIQGQDAARGQFPFYVYLNILVKDGIAGCGGSLISNEWVVTAAHCLQNAQKAIVHLGSLRGEDFHEQGRKIYPIDPENMHVYPRFSLLFFAWNDIGLIKLPEPVTFNDIIKPISFSCSLSVDNGLDVTAIGNGLTNSTQVTFPKILQYTKLKTISTLSCLKTFPFLAFRRSVICVEGEELRSACQGDSGGPLVTSNNLLLGLTSFGSSKGCEEGAPQVFTKIAKYAQWIEEVSGVKCKN